MRQEQEQYEQYEQVEFPNQTNKTVNQYQSQNVFNQPILLSKKEEDQMLYSININDNHNNQGNSNLLDLSFEEENQVSQDIKYRDFVSERVCRVSEPATIHDGYIITYKLYRIKTKKQGSKEYDTAVDRRYSDFQYLHSKFIENFGGCVIPCLPQKNLWATLDMQTVDDKKLRKKYLQKYLKKVLQHPKLRYSSALKEFLFDKQRNFSAKKGQFTAQNRIEDKIWKFTSNIYNYGSHIAHQYISHSSQKVTGQTGQPTPRTKQQNQVLHYKMLIDNMSEIMKGLKLILDNTVQQQKQFQTFNILSLGLLTQNYYEISPDTQSDNSDEGDQNPKQNHLINKYQEILEFIISCQESLNRWYMVHLQLNQLKIQEKSSDDKHNPRNTKLDIIRSQISKNNKKMKQWTKDLISELESNIVLGKSLTSNFIEELTNSKAKLYDNCL